MPFQLAALLVLAAGASMGCASSRFAVEVSCDVVASDATTSLTAAQLTPTAPGGACAVFRSCSWSNADVLFVGDNVCVHFDATTLDGGSIAVRPAGASATLSNVELRAASGSTLRGGGPVLAVMAADAAVSGVVIDVNASSVRSTGSTASWDNVTAAASVHAATCRDVTITVTHASTVEAHVGGDDMPTGAALAAGTWSRDVADLRVVVEGATTVVADAGRGQAAVAAGIFHNESVTLRRGSMTAVGSMLHASARASSQGAVAVALGVAAPVAAAALDEMVFAATDATIDASIEAGSRPFGAAVALGVASALGDARLSDATLLLSGSIVSCRSEPQLRGVATCAGVASSEETAWLGNASITLAASRAVALCRVTDNDCVAVVGGAGSATAIVNINAASIAAVDVNLTGISGALWNAAAATVGAATGPSSVFVADTNISAVRSTLTSRSHAAQTASSFYFAAACAGAAAAGGTAEMVRSRIALIASNVTSGAEDTAASAACAGVAGKRTVLLSDADVAVVESSLRSAGSSGRTYAAATCAGAAASDGTCTIQRARIAVSDSTLWSSSGTAREHTAASSAGAASGGGIVTVHDTSIVLLQSHVNASSGTGRDAAAACAGAAASRQPVEVARTSVEVNASVLGCRSSTSGQGAGSAAAGAASGSRGCDVTASRFAAADSVLDSVSWSGGGYAGASTVGAACGGAFAYLTNSSARVVRCTATSSSSSASNMAAACAGAATGFSAAWVFTSTVAIVDSEVDVRSIRPTADHCAATAAGAATGGGTSTMTNSSAAVVASTVRVTSQAASDRGATVGAAGRFDYVRLGCCGSTVEVEGDNTIVAGGASAGSVRPVATAAVVLEGSLSALGGTCGNLVAAGAPVAGRAAAVLRAPRFDCSRVGPAPQPADSVAVVGGMFIGNASAPVVTVDAHYPDAVVVSDAPTSPPYDAASLYSDCHTMAAPPAMPWLPLPLDLEAILRNVPGARKPRPASLTASPSRSISLAHRPATATVPMQRTVTLAARPVTTPAASDASPAPSIETPAPPSPSPPPTPRPPRGDNTTRTITDHSPVSQPPKAATASVTVPAQGGLATPESQRPVPRAVVSAVVAIAAGIGMGAVSPATAARVPLIAGARAAAGRCGYVEEDVEAPLVEYPLQFELDLGGASADGSPGSTGFASLNGAAVLTAVALAVSVGAQQLLVRAGKLRAVPHLTALVGLLLGLALPGGVAAFVTVARFGESGGATVVHAGSVAAHVAVLGLCAWRVLRAVPPPEPGAAGAQAARCALAAVLYEGCRVADGEAGPHAAAAPRRVYFIADVAASAVVAALAGYRASPPHCRIVAILGFVTCAALVAYHVVLRTMASTAELVGIVGTAAIQCATCATGVAVAFGAVASEQGLYWIDLLSVFAGVWLLIAAIVVAVMTVVQRRRDGAPANEASTNGADAEMVLLAPAVADGTEGVVSNPLQPSETVAQ